MFFYIVGGFVKLLCIDQHDVWNKYSKYHIRSFLFYIEIYMDVGRFGILNYNSILKMYAEPAFPLYRVSQEERT